MRFIEKVYGPTATIDDRCKKINGGSFVVESILLVMNETLFLSKYFEMFEVLITSTIC